MAIRLAFLPIDGSIVPAWGLQALLLVTIFQDGWRKWRRGRPDPAPNTGTITQLLPIGAFRISLDREVLYANPRCLEICEHKDFLGSDVRTIVSDQDKARFDREWDEALEAKAPFHIEFRVAKPEGLIRWVRVEATQDLDAHGSATGYIGFLMDITDQKESTEILKEQVERYRFVTESIQDIVTVLDSEGRICYENPSASAMLGYFPHLRKGRNALESVHPKDRSIAKSMLAKVFKNPGKRYGMTVRYIGAGGSFHQMEFVGAAHREHTGELRAVVTSRDMTERKRMEDALKGSEERFSKAFHASTDAVAIAECHDGHPLIEINEGFENTFGHSRENALGKRLGDLKLFQDTQRFEDLLSQAMRGEKVRHVELGFLSSTGTEGTCNLSLDVITVRGRKHFLITALDITQRKLAEKSKASLEAQLQQAQRLETIGTLAGGIAHDFNNILQAILGYTELARLVTSQDRKTLEYLERVGVACRRGRDLIKRILLFSRGAGPDPETKTGLVSLQSITKEGLGMLRASLPSSIEVRQEIDPGVSAVIADPAQISQIILNLCTNAGQAMPDGGILKVILEGCEIEEETPQSDTILKPGKYAHLSVRDTGAGMTEETKKRLFEPFYTTKPPGTGTGLGLSVVHGIVTSLQGEITVQSDLGKGTVFDVYLPLAGLRESPAENLKRSVPLGREHILLVDDEKEIIRSLGILLTTFGYKVTTSLDSRQALGVFERSPQDIDLIITDHTMPHINGNRLAEIIKRIRPDIPIIMVSGHQPDADSLPGESRLIKKYIMKPVSPDALGRAVREVLDARHHV